MKPGMHAVWRPRPVFISSTFLDMHAERDWLRSHVFPELEEHLRAHRHYLEPIDLRQGVETAELDQADMREAKVLKVCLSEIERSRPYIIILLGDRYGWVPPVERTANAAQEAGFDAPPSAKSVTALEIEFGILKKTPGQKRRCFFYFRDPLPYQRMPAEVAALFSDAHSPEPDQRARHDDLLALKARIEADPELRPRVRHYSAVYDPESGRVVGLEAWGRQVLRDLQGELESEAETQAYHPPSTWEAAERAELEEFIEQHARGFFGRDALVRRLVDLALVAPSPPMLRGVCLTGSSGSGKSALFAYLHRQISSDGPDAPLVLAHAAGTSPRSISVDDMLRRWIVELAAAQNLAPPELSITTPPERVEEVFLAALRKVAESRRVVVLIDALNQFERTARGFYATWFDSSRWPADVCVITTAIPGSESRSIVKQVGMEEVEVPGLDLNEARTIGLSIWKRYHRECNAHMLTTVLDLRKPTDGFAHENPLWLTLAMEQLNLLDADDFDRAGQNLDQFVRSEASHLPPQVEGLYSSLLDRAEKNFGTEWARTFACLIALGRQGWRESDFEKLLPSAAAMLFPDGKSVRWDALHFAALRRGFRAHVIQRGAKTRWDFFHLQAREAVDRMYLRDVDVRGRLHGIIADHLLSLEPTDPLRLGETLHHLMGADDKPRAAHFYAHLPIPYHTPSEATRTLAEALLADDAPVPGGALDWFVVMIGQTDLADDTRWRLCSRCQYDLNDALEACSALLIRRRIFEATRSCLEHLVSSDPSQTDWQYDLGISHERLGHVLQAQGDLNGALVNYRKKGEIIGRLANAAPSNPWWQRDLGVALENMGGILMTQGDSPRALEAYRMSLEISQGLAISDPSNTHYQRDLGVSYEKIGDVLVHQGDLAEALRAYRETAAVRKRLVEAHPRNTEYQRDLSVNLDKVGEVMFAQGDSTGAIDAFRESLAIAQHLVKSDPTNAEWKRDLNVSHLRMGDALRERGDLAGALVAFRESLRIVEILAKADVSNTENQRDVSTSLDRIGHALLANGDLDGAIDAIEKSLQIGRRLATIDPSNAQWKRDVSASLLKLGDAFRAQGFRAKALDVFQEALSIDEALTVADPSDAKCQRGVSVCLERIAEVQRDQGDVDEALQTYQKSLVIARRLASADPANLDWQHDLSISLRNVGDLQFATGDLVGAMDAFQESLDITKRLVSADPSNAQWQHGFGLGHDRVGSVLKEKGDLAGALAAFRKREEIVERLAVADPSNSEWQDDLNTSYLRLGDVLYEQKDVEGALEAYRDSLTIGRRLTADDPNNADWQRGLSVTLNKVGDMMLARGDVSGAVEKYRESLAARRSLVEADPLNATWQRDLAVSYMRLANVLEKEGSPEAGEYWILSYKTFESMEKSGLFISASDAKGIEFLRKKAWYAWAFTAKE